MACTCKRGNEPSVSIKCGEFLGQQRTCFLLKDSAPWSKQVVLNANKISSDLFMLLFLYFST